MKIEVVSRREESHGEEGRRITAFPQGANEGSQVKTAHVGRHNHPHLSEGSCGDSMALPRPVGGS